jgi:TM2 domain-containing membrane protein YozV
MGIAIVMASLAVGAGQTYLSANATGFFGYTPNAVVAIIGVIVAIIGGIVDPMIDNWLQRSTQLGEPGKKRN